MLNIYPNPAGSYLAIRWTSTRFGQTADRQIIKMFDVCGKMIREIASATMLPRNDGTGEIKVSLKGINPGIYFLRLGKETKKFIVVK